MLRAVRIASRLGFEIERGTAEAIQGAAGLLGQISRERIGQEVSWMLTPLAGEPAICHADPVRAIGLMQSLGLDAGVLDEPAMPGCACRTVEGLLAGEGGTGGGWPGVGYGTVLAGWAIDRHVFGCGGGWTDGLEALRCWANGRAAGVVRGWRRSLCLSNEVRDELAGALCVLRDLLSWSGLRVSRRKRLLASSGACGGLGLLEALAHDGSVMRVAPGVLAEARELLESGVAPDPLVGGQDLIELGIKPGVVFGRLLNEVYDAQLEGVLSDRAGALRWVRERARDVSGATKRGSCC